MKLVTVNAPEKVAKPIVLLALATYPKPLPVIVPPVCENRAGLTGGVADGQAPETVIKGA